MLGEITLRLRQRKQDEFLMLRQCTAQMPYPQIVSI